MTIAGNDDSLNIDPKAFWEIMNEETPHPVQQTRKNRPRQPKKQDKPAPVPAARSVFQAVVLQQAPRLPPASVSIANASEDVKPSLPYPCSTQTNGSTISPSFFQFHPNMAYLNVERPPSPNVLDFGHYHAAQVAAMQEKLQSSPASASEASTTKRPREVHTVEDDVGKDIKLTFPASSSIQTNASSVSLDSFLFPADMDYLKAAGPSKALDWGICHTAQALQSQLFMKREFQALDSSYKNLQSLYDQLVESEKVATARHEVLEAELANVQAELVLSKKQKSLAELELESSRNEMARLKKELNDIVGKVDQESHNATAVGTDTVMHEGEAGDTNNSEGLGVVGDDSCVTIAAYGEPKEVDQGLGTI